MTRQRKNNRILTTCVRLRRCIQPIQVALARSVAACEAVMGRPRPRATPRAPHRTAATSTPRAEPKGFLSRSRRPHPLARRAKGHPLEPGASASGATGRAAACSGRRDKVGDGGACEPRRATWPGRTARKLYSPSAGGSPLFVSHFPRSRAPATHTPQPSSLLQTPASPRLPDQVSCRSQSSSVLLLLLARES